MLNKVNFFSFSIYCLCYSLYSLLFRKIIVMTLNGLKKQCRLRLDCSIGAVWLGSTVFVSIPAVVLLFSQVVQILAVTRVGYDDRIFGWLNWPIKYTSSLACFGLKNEVNKQWKNSTLYNVDIQKYIVNKFRLIQVQSLSLTNAPLVVYAVPQNVYLCSMCYQMLIG